ncbi:32683_t:CDS:2 [Gigaspora margarita]|uniref:32683_t:CDS:1 n=1 Tax=Gigaspora margarita TaxID=4874 RepID=A0ABN7UBE2_GIGMA|nr:32683_t:CDS:2 [Gigaspora margarita]
MDEEARKKFCHLLMFDVPENGQDAISTNDDISSNEIDNPHHFAYSYDNGSIFKRIVEPLNHVHNIIESSALDVSNSSESNTAIIDSSSGVQSSVQTSSIQLPSVQLPSVQLPSVQLPSVQLPSVQLPSVQLPSPRARKPKRTPRPPNAFILYRKNKQPDVVAQNKNLTNAEVSKVISKMWWKETEEIRFQWEKLADRMKLKHMQDHPDYVYQPKKPGTKKPRKLSKIRDCNSSITTTTSSSSSSSSTTTFSAIPPSDKYVSMADEAMITAIAESAFAESKSSPPSFLYPVTPNSPSSSFPSPPLSERSSNQSSVHTPSSPIIETNTKSFFNNSTHHNLDTFLDPQPVDKFQYFVQGFDSGALLEELFSSSNTVTANSTPDVDDMDAYFDEPCSSQHHFQNLHFSRRSSFASMS